MKFITARLLGICKTSDPSRSVSAGISVSNLPCTGISMRSSFERRPSSLFINPALGDRRFTACNCNWRRLAMSKQGQEEEVQHGRVLKSSGVSLIWALTDLSRRERSVRRNGAWCGQRRGEHCKRKQKSHLAGSRFPYHAR